MEMEGGGGVCWHVFGQKKPGGKEGDKDQGEVGVETSDTSLVRRNQWYGDSWHVFGQKQPKRMGRVKNTSGDLWHVFGQGKPRGKEGEGSQKGG